MQPLWIVRIFFILLLTYSGYWIGQPARILETTGLALLIALLIVGAEYTTRFLSTKVILLGSLGATMGLLFSRLFVPTLPTGLFPDPQAPALIFNVLFMYLGVVLLLRNADRISLSRLRFFVGAASENGVLLDTSVLIDGRVIHLYSLGFMTRSSIVPSFVVDELQSLADSRDPARRQAGRRGLENLELLQSVDQDLQLYEKRYPNERAVDQMLILLAKELGSAIVTNDYNLARVGKVHHVKTLNLNELSAALRHNLAVGDQVTVSVQRPGKEEGQGVGHLDDGTMVVVEDGRPFIGQQTHVVIVSILPTSAGRLAFARLLEQQPQEERPVARIEVVGPPA